MGLTNDLRSARRQLALQCCDIHCSDRPHPAVVGLGLRGVELPPMLRHLWCVERKRTPPSPKQQQNDAYDQQQGHGDDTEPHDEVLSSIPIPSNCHGLRNLVPRRCRRRRSRRGRAAGAGRSLWGTELPSDAERAKARSALQLAHGGEGHDDRRRRDHHVPVHTGAGRRSSRRARLVLARGVLPAAHEALRGGVQLIAVAELRIRGAGLQGGYRGKPSDTPGD
mmetsp:Transcript_71134/g.191590  ORF Transcript_71134/g.191590 Transcript_71134/m.191590 type:complete len:223 (-) Transcript_71134:917-1585(-)